MTNQSDSIRIALVLPGGGARGAFQVGVLKALVEILPKSSPNPFPIISGTSAGAVNSVVLASKAERFRSAVTELELVWANFRCHQVYKTDDHYAQEQFALVVLDRFRWLARRNTQIVAEQCALARTLEQKCALPPDPACYRLWLSAGGRGYGCRLRICAIDVLF